MSTTTMPGRKAKRQVQLPFIKSFEFAMQSIRIRFWRSMITAGGIFLGIAFLASVLTDKAIKGAGVSPDELARMNWLVGLSLLVCAVGITNSMLMSVSERFREIGTMKCLGALNEFVVRIFMIEAALMGAIASAMGWTTGTGLFVLTKLITFDAKKALPGVTALGSLDVGDLFGWYGYMPGTFWFCMLIGIILTVAATYIPAMQAARIPPAAALRIDV